MIFGSWEQVVVKLQNPVSKKVSIWRLLLWIQPWLSDKTKARSTDIFSVSTFSREWWKLLLTKISAADRVNFLNTFATAVHHLYFNTDWVENECDKMKTGCLKKNCKEESDEEIKSKTLNALILLGILPFWDNVWPEGGPLVRPLWGQSIIAVCYVRIPVSLVHVHDVYVISQTTVIGTVYPVYLTFAHWRVSFFFLCVRGGFVIAMCSLLKNTVF